MNNDIFRIPKPRFVVWNHFLIKSYCECKHKLFQNLHSGKVQWPRVELYSNIADFGVQPSALSLQPPAPIVAWKVLDERRGISSSPSL